jgi:hypothetical protein
MTTGNLFNASSSALGYLYQCRYALLLLIQKSARNSALTLTIERFDDVAFDDKGTPRELIQTKHHLGQTPNLTDASPDLWKTLRVWSDGVLRGIFYPEDVLLTIVTTATASIGSIASLLRHDDRDEATAVERLFQIANNSASVENRAAYRTFLQLTDEQRQALVSAMWVLDDAPDITDTLPEIKIALTFAAPRERLDDLVSALEGWWFDTVVRHLSSQDGGSITCQALFTKLADLREQYRRDALPLDFCFVDPPQLPSPSSDTRTFVTQLRIVDCSEATISNAICDHYKSSGQRSQWIREELMLLDEWDGYKRTLTGEWERRFAWAQEDLSPGAAPDEEKRAGRGIYRDLQDKGLHIRSDCTEPCIMRGCYHDLADGKHVGWHPRFTELLGDGENQ